MKSHFIKIFILILLLSAFPLRAELLFLKDGSIIKGKIISNTKKEIIIQDEQDNELSYPRKKIMRIVNKNLKSGKLVIQKSDGIIIEAFMVDEDQDGYIFRKELNNPEEFTLKKSEVLVISEKNPSGLKVDGKVRPDSVSISWLPPYGSVKKYNIYIKKNEKDKYELADSTTDKTITLKNLTAKTIYYLMVTSIDSDNNESLPGSELKITTSAIINVMLKNEKVFKAYLLAEDSQRYTLCYDLDGTYYFIISRFDVLYITEKFPNGLRGNAGTESIELKWFEPYKSEPVEEYKVYIKKPGEEYNPVSSSRDNSYTIKGLLKNTEYSFKVTGIRKDKTETDSSNELTISTKAYEEKESQGKSADVKNLLPSGIRISYMLTLPYTAPGKDTYIDLHGVDITYSYFFNNYISIKTGINFVLGYKPIESAITLQNSFAIGVNFGFPVARFIYPYAGVALKGLWLHEEVRKKLYDFGGIGVDGSVGIAFTLTNYFGLYTEYTIGWGMVFDKSSTDVSTMSIKAGLYFRF